MDALQETEGKLVRPEYEEALIGYMLTTGKSESLDNLIWICDKLSPDDFSSNKNATMFAGISDIVKKGEKPDIITLNNMVRDVPGANISASDIANRMSGTFIRFQQAETAVKLISDYALKRRAVRVLEDQIQVSIHGVGESGAVITGEELIAQSQSKLLALTDDIKDDRPTDIMGIMDEATERVKEYKRLGRLGYSTGFSRLDQALGGMIPSHIWLVGAYTGTGKTFLTIQMILNILEQGGNVALFSTEMDRTSTYLRILGNVAGIPALKLMRGDLDIVEENRKKEAEKILKGFEGKLTIYDNAYTVDAIRLKCKRQQLAGGLDVFFLDFVQNLRGSESIYERMSVAAVELQQLCKEVNACGILLSQVSNESGKNANQDVIQYKGAGELAAIADVGLWLNRSDTPGKLQMLIRKSRHGVSGVESYIDIDYSLGGRMTQGIAPDKTSADAL